MSRGRLPDSSFFVRATTCIVDMLNIENGIEPVRKEGSGPMKLLFCKFKYLSFGKRRSQRGRFPLKLLTLQSRNLKRRMLARFGGRLPWKLFCRRSRETRKERWPSSGGTSPVKPMPERWSSVTLRWRDSQLTPTQLQGKVRADQFVAMVLFGSDVMWALRARRAI
nr:hypothetical protein F511_45136 [Ipomoea batatas]